MVLSDLQGRPVREEAFLLQAFLVTFVATKVTGLRGQERDGVSSNQQSRYLSIGMFRTPVMMWRSCYSSSDPPDLITQHNTCFVPNLSTPFSLPHPFSNALQAAGFEVEGFLRGVQPRFAEHERRNLPARYGSRWLRQIPG